jgi:hypothetical protein
VVRLLGKSGLKGRLGWGTILLAVVVALALVAAGAWMESTFLILLGMLGVPVLLVGAAVLHYLQLAERAGWLGQAQSRTFQGHCERWGRALDDHLRKATEAGVPEEDRKALVEGVRRAVAAHATLGEKDGKHHIAPGSDVPGGGWLHRTDLAIKGLQEEAGRRAIPGLQARLEALQARFPADAPFQREPLPAGSLGEVCEAYLRQVRRGGAFVTSRISGVEQAISEVEAEGLDVSEAWNHHRSARRLWTEGQVDLALRALDSAEAIVNNHLQPEFDARHQRLSSDIGSATAIEGLAGFASPALWDRLQRLQGDVGHLQLAGGGLAALEREERAFAQVLEDARRECHQRAKDARDTIAQQRAFGDAEGATDVVDALANIPAVTHPYQKGFSEWYETMRNVLPRLGRSVSNAALDRWMPRLEGRIRDQLVQRGQVRPTDLPVRERAEEILQRYAQLHPEDVEFHDGGLRRRAPGGGA